MRSYKAARRAALKEPVQFEVVYDAPVEHRDPDTGRVTGTTIEEQAETFTCRGNITTLMLSELAAQSDLDNQSEEGAALIRNVFWQAFNDAAEYTRFFKVATRHLDDDEVFDIMGNLIEDLAGRPTVQPSRSPETSSTTTDSGPTSRREELLAELGELTSAPTPAPEETVVSTARVVRADGTVETLAAPTPEQLAAADEVDKLNAMLATPDTADAQA